MKMVSHVVTSLVVGLLMLFAATCGVHTSAQQPTQADEAAAADETFVDVDALPEAAQVSAVQPTGIPWPLTALSGAIVGLLMGLLFYRLFKTTSDGVTRGIDEVRPRVLIGGMVAVLLLYGFFFTLYHLLGMLPRNNSAADRIPGEYWLFIGQALGILGSLALNVATYYFGSSSSGEDERRLDGGGDGDRNRTDQAGGASTGGNP